MEVSALKYSGGIGLHGRSRLLRLQSDERLVAFVRKGNTAAFEVVVSRYETRLLAFCRHLLGSREDAEDVLQEVMAAAFNAMLADDRPINVRPWLYRIARNRSLNHLRRTQAIGMDSMDIHLSDHGESTADKVHEREEFWLLVGNIHELPETQKTALVLREMDALSYDQIAEVMETTVPSVKSLLVRARVSLAEAAQARLLSCEEVRIELGEVAEGLRRRPNPLVRRHLRDCTRCTVFRAQLKHTNKALAALLPIGPTVILKKLLIAHLGHSAGASSGASAAGSGAGAAGAAGAGAGTAIAGSTVLTGSSGLVSAGIGALATKAAAGLAAAALVTGAAVEVGHNTVTHHPPHHVTTVASVQHAGAPAQQTSLEPVYSRPERRSIRKAPPERRPAPAPTVKSPTPVKPLLITKVKADAATKAPVASVTPPANVRATPTGRTQNQTDTTVLPPATPPPSAPAPPASGITTTGAGWTIPTPPDGTSTAPPVQTTPAPPGATTAPPATTPGPASPVSPPPAPARVPSQNLMPSSSSTVVAPAALTHARRHLRKFEAHLGS